MSNTSGTEKIVLYVDSSFRTTGTNENFTITINSAINKVLQVEVVSAEIPYSFYTINANNNKLCFRSGSTDYITTLPVGSYTVVRFVEILQTALNTTFGGFTVTYDRENFKLTFTNASAFQLQISNTQGTSTLAPKIGLTSSSSVVTNFTCQGAINIAGPKYILIKSDRLTLPKITRPFLNNSQQSILYKIPVQGGPGDVIVEKNYYTNLLKYGVRQSIKTIDFQLTDDQNNPLDLNGLSWSLTINLVTG